MIVKMLGVLASATVIAMISPLPSEAASIPFTDSNAQGSIGICDSNGNVITSGKIGDAPFARLAVSSNAAPSGFASQTGKATLYVYQPRKNVDAGDWSGKQLTAASDFTNTAHPMVQGTSLDPALVDFTSVFAPQWDGLVQLRMYFTAANRPAKTAPYPATVLKIDGDKWSVVNPAAADCKAGSAVSVESKVVSSESLAAPAARTTLARGESPATSASPGATVAAPGAATEDPSGDAAALAAKSKSSGNTLALGLGGAAAVVALIAGGLWWRARRV